MVERILSVGGVVVKVEPDGDDMRQATVRRGRKHEHVADTLRRRILAGEFRVGESLPSIQELGKTFSLSAMTAHRGVQELVREGLLTCNARSQGMIVARTTAMRPVAQTTLACLLRFLRPRTEEDTFELDMIGGAQREISERGYRFIHHSLSESDYESRVTDLAQSGSVSGILLDERTPISAIRRLAALPVPVAMFNRWEAVPNLTCIAVDYARAGAETARVLVEKGYRRLAFCYKPSDEDRWDEVRIAQRNAFLNARRGFFESVARLSVPPADAFSIDEVVDPARFMEPESYGLPRQKPADWRPLGIFTATDKWAAFIIDALSKTDMVLGRDVGVIGYNDLGWGRMSRVPPSTWSVDPAEIGALAAKSLIDRIENPDIPGGTVILPMKFVDRGTA